MQGLPPAAGQEAPARPAAPWRTPVETHIGPALRSRIGAVLGEAAAAVPDGGPMKRRPAVAAASSFKPGARRLLPEAVAAGMKGLDAKGRKAAALSFHGLLDAYEKDAPKHDAAHALAFCLATCRQVARGRELDSLEARDLSRRAEGLLPGLAEFAALKDRDRQAMYESLILTGAMVGGLAKQAAEQGDEPAARQARALAAQVLAGFGLPSEPQP
jgi:hypothetical protein